jgi:peptide/nickel transport system permease protein
LAGVSVLSFVLLQLAPGDFFSEMKMGPNISPETVRALRAQYGLDQPLALRYASWIASVARGEFGFSFAYNMPAAPLLRARALNTLLLTMMAVLLAWALAVPLGVLAAARRRGFFDRVLGGGISALLAVPDLMIALACVALAVKTGWFPVGGIGTVQAVEAGFAAKLKDVLWHSALPVTAIVLGMLPVLVRHVRSSMIEVLDAPFVQAARSHGLRTTTIWFRYCLRAALNPLISLFGFSVATLLSASLLVEVVMSWPGLGPLLLEAILARDVYVVIGAVMFSAIFLITGNFIADILLYLADPRIREGHA